MSRSRRSKAPSPSIRFSKSPSGNRFSEGQLPNHVEIIFPPDDRTQVTNTTVYPYSSIGELDMEFDGEPFGGTGVLIDDSIVLTAAHNLYDRALGGEADSVTFAAARNGTSNPFGVVEAESLFVPDGYKTADLKSILIDGEEIPDAEKPYRRFDYGLVLLKSAPHKGQGFLGISVEDQKVLQDLKVNVTGYPGDKPEGTMWGAQGGLSGVEPDFLLYRLSTFAGESGASVIASLPDKTTKMSSVGIHIGVTEDRSDNLAVRITDAVVDQIIAWLGSLA